LSIKNTLNRQKNKLFDAFSSYWQNYQFGFVYGHNYLDDNDVDEIENVLNSKRTDKDLIEKYETSYSALVGDGNGISFAAGRMAFFMLMKSLGIGPGDEVIMLGFTCSVMPNAVLRIGANPVFTDLDPETFGSDPGSIESKITSRTKIVVAQHSFGIPCKINEIKQICTKHNLFLFEDCAITLDSSIDGTRVGNFGDAALFSTDHSKPINTILGGLLYTRDKDLYQKIKNETQDILHLDFNHQKNLFKQFLFERKYFTPSKYAKVKAHNYFKEIKNKINGKGTQVFLEEDYVSPVFQERSYPYPAKYPSFLAKIGLHELKRWEKTREHRKSIQKEYLNILNDLSLNKYIPDSYSDNSLDIVPLRFVLTLPRVNILKKIISKHIDIKWNWFDDPIVIPREGDKSIKCKNCLYTDKVCNQIINWPCNLHEGWEPLLFKVYKESLIEFFKQI
jgi:perosamine synthetase